MKKKVKTNKEKINRWVMFQPDGKIFLGTGEIKSTDNKNMLVIDLNKK